ncbi:hypothetical protein [Mucilaginibacter pedocola]|uniref:Copper resistance protein NlpE n=1 Tax=Mucilaginibacter pedocola TaxID=1792845 RepID=A0A1S9P829_9SPHI|nr:hypothetical protein [Mucilaginibacter pedocola]OOQ57111.1 hypothetical protein BC343_16425 [Mucilaginibacter pedocola]
MKRHQLTLLLIAAAGLCLLMALKSPTVEMSTSETYKGNSPCGNYIKPILGIASGADCERVSWQLVLYTNEEKQPAGFKLTGVYGMQQQGGPGFIGGGKAFSVEGNWQLTKGSKANPEAGVYQLVTKSRGHVLSFVKMNDDIIHLLYTDGSLMVGNGGWSYTLNRVKQ